ncbi:MAG: rod shape-determining protein RodA [Polaribacter sp.]
MRREKNNIFADVDWLLIFIYILLIGFGWMNIYAASSSPDANGLFDFSTRYGKQFIWIALCLPIVIIILFFNSKFYEQFASIFYFISLLALLLLFVFGKEINGARSWFSFGGMSLQPSEFAKTFTALAVAKLMSDRTYNLDLIKNQIKAFIIIFLPAFFILLQPDAGSALIYFSFFFVLNREGLTIKYILMGIGLIVGFILTILYGKAITLLWLLGILTVIMAYFIYRQGSRFLRFQWYKIVLSYVVILLYILIVNYTYNSVFKQHHRDRFEVLLGLKVDTKNIGYNTYQSQLTISSGGVSGKGFLKGDITQGNFVPEQDTDYIFSTVGEEWGFIGSTAVIILFMFLIFRIIALSETNPNKFGRIYGYGVASILFFHLFVNVGMVIGLLPTVGIPLPFFSYGGSSLWGFTILLFIFIRLDAHKSYDW